MERLPYHPDGAGHGSGTKRKPGHQIIAVRAELVHTSALDRGGGGLEILRVASGICTRHGKAKIVL